MQSVCCLSFLLTFKPFAKSELHTWRACTNEPKCTTKKSKQIKHANVISALQMFGISKNISHSSSIIVTFSISSVVHGSGIIMSLVIVRRALHFHNQSAAAAHCCNVPCIHSLFFCSYRRQRNNFEKKYKGWDLTSALSPYCTDINSENGDTISCSGHLKACTWQDRLQTLICRISILCSAKTEDFVFLNRIHRWSSINEHQEHYIYFLLR